jgi:hypothetical protein
MPDIDYHRIIEDGPEDFEDLILYLERCLPSEWLSAYEQMTPARTNVHEFTQNGFRYLFDLAYELSPGHAMAASGAECRHVRQDDRAVVAYGRSTTPARPRDKGRMRWHPRGEPRLDDEGLQIDDRGHLIGHALGGGITVNLVQQLTSLNRGRSAEGRVLRAMESYCAAHQGTLCFCRPIYSDHTAIPSQFEYGVMLPPRQLWLEVFSNRVDLGQLRQDPPWS